MTDGEVNATLAGMLDRAGFESACTAAPFGTRSCDDATLLAGAIRAVLKLADEWATEAKRIDGIFASDEDPWPRTVGGMRAEAFESCAGKVRAAITAALTGKEAGNGT